MYRFHTKLVVLCIAIGIVPLMILGLLTYNISNSIENDLIDANTQVLFQTQKRVEEALKIIDNSMIQFINTPTISSIMSAPRNNDHYNAFRDAAASMYRMQTYETEVSDMFLVSNQYDWIISNKLMNDIKDVGLTDFVKKLNGIQKTSFWYNTVNDRTQEDINGRSMTEASGVILVKKIPVNTITSDGLAIIELPTYSIKKLISGENLSHKVLILDETGTVISSDDNIFPEGEELYKPFLSRITSDKADKGYFFNEVNKQDYMVIYERSKYNGWTYISFTPASVVFHKSNSIKNLTLIIVAGMLTFILLLAWKGSQGLYSPVRKLYSLAEGNRENTDPPKKSRDEFNFINDAVEKLIVNNKKYRNEITEKSNTVRLFFLRRLLQGEIEQKQIRASLDNHSIQYLYKGFSLVGVKIDSFENTFFGDDKKLLLFAVGNILSELSEEDINWIPVLLKEEYFLLTMSNEPHPQFKEFVFRKVQLIQSSLKTYLNLSVSIGVSCLFSAIEDIIKAKSECDEALKYCVKNGSGSVTFMDLVKTSRFTNSITLSDKKTVLLAAVKSGRIDEAEEGFDLCLSDITGSELDINMFQFEIVSLIIDIVKVIQAIDRDFEFSIDDFLSNFNSIDKMVSYIKTNLIIIGCNKYNDYRKNIKKSIFEQVIEYVNANITKDISLESCAKHLNYNANYISRVFKAEMSMKFIDYVASQKMKIVKDMLANSDMSITEISRKLSYNNPQNFIRSFKKVTGMTPGQFRNNSDEE